MKERGILFSAPMVRALLDGAKTQTRRVVKITHRTPGLSACLEPPVGPPRPRVAAELCPYGQPGDRLWVRETFMDLTGTGVEHRDASGLRQRYAFAADSPPGSYGDDARKDFGLKWKPSIHMPRAASRILLEVVAVRVERLQDISEADAKAEGITPHEVRQLMIFGASPAERAAIYRDAAVGPYCGLWKQINGAGSWDANPWVWVVEFQRVES